MTIEFVNLHAHSNTGSPLDAMGTPTEWLQSAIDKGLNAHAITDHGNMNGLAEMVQAAKALNKNDAGEEEVRIKPIYGVEAYFVPSLKEWQKDKTWYEENSKRKDLTEEEAAKKIRIKNLLRKRSHLVLLAMNETGLKNLYKIVSRSHMDGNFYYMPRVDLELVSEYSEGIIASSACIGGVMGEHWFRMREEVEEVKKEGRTLPDTHTFIDKYAINADELYEKMHSINKQFLEVFGDRWYNELQWNRIPGQDLVNKFVIKSAQDLGIPLISTVDCHFINRSDWQSRELYWKMRFMRGKDEERDKEYELPESIEDVEYEIFMKNGEEVWESYKRFAGGLGYDDDMIMASIKRTQEVADRCEFFYPDNSVNLPSFVVPEGKNADDHLRDLCYKALKKCTTCTPEYEKQLDLELDVIISRGFAKYFLTMKKIMDTAKDHYLCGPARGSAAGALVSYLLKITDVDPMKYDLQFSRFLTKDGSGYPDIDSDVSSPADLKEKMKELWGPTSLAYVSNWTTLKVKNLIKDLSKIMGVDFKVVNEVTTKMVGEAIDGVRHERKDEHISSSYQPTFEEIKEYSGSYKGFIEEHPEFEEHIERLAGAVRDLSTHAGGAIIGDHLEDQMPLIRKKDKLQTPWPEGQAKRLLEPMGFIKFDILGLSTLKMFEDAIRLILKRQYKIAEPTFAQVKVFYNEVLNPRVLDLTEEDVYKKIFHDGRWLGIFQYGQNGIQRFCQRLAPTCINDLAVLTSVYRPGPLSAQVDSKYLQTQRGERKPEYYHPIHREITESTQGFIIFQEQISKLVSRLGKDISDDEGQKVRKGLTKNKDNNNPVVKAFYPKFIEGCVEKGIAKEQAEKFWKEIEFFAGYGFNKSHATSYSIVSYQCAWLAHHYPVEWACAYLIKEMGPNLAKAVADVQKAGFEIKGVDINTSGISWEPVDEKTIAQPLSAIKGMPKKAIATVLANRPINTVEEVLFRFPRGAFNKKAKSVCIRSGAVDDLVAQSDHISNKRQLWMAFESKPKGFKSEAEFAETLLNFQEVDDFTFKEMVDNIFSLTGLFPAAKIAPMELIESLNEEDVMSFGDFAGVLEEVETSPDFSGNHSYKNLLFWFIIKSYEIKKTKTKKEYCQITATDNEGNDRQIKCWSTTSIKAAEKLEKYRVFLAKLDYDSRWGLSSLGLKTFQQMN